MNNPYHILLVDDEMFLRRTTEVILQNAGYRVDTVGTGQEGLILLQQKGYDLMILDQMLPDVRGTSLLTQVQQFLPHLPVVMLSGSTTHSDREEARQLGVKTFLQKPIEPEELLKRIQEILQ